MVVQVFVDSRELKLFPYLTQGVSTGLDIGDIVLRDASFEIIMERKTWKDLYASIQDGRYREQRARLLACKNDHCAVVYIIEGDGSQSLEKSVYDICQRTLFRLAVTYSVIVHYTSNIEDTARWIRWVIERDTLALYFQKRDSQQDRIESVYQCRKSIQDPKTLLIGTLLSIHGVSYSIASTIAQPFFSLRELMNADLENYLSSLEYVVEKTQKQRKLGKKLVTKILSLLDGNSPTP